jgi:hypothetical protein
MGGKGRHAGRKGPQVSRLELGCIRNDGSVEHFSIFSCSDLVLHAAVRGFQSLRRMLSTAAAQQTLLLVQVTAERSDTLLSAQPSQICSGYTSSDGYQ